MRSGSHRLESSVHVKFGRFGSLRDWVKGGVVLAGGRITSGNFIHVMTNYLGPKDRVQGVSDAARAVGGPRQLSAESAW